MAQLELCIRGRHVGPEVLAPDVRVCKLGGIGEVEGDVGNVEYEVIRGGGADDRDGTGVQMAMS